MDGRVALVTGALSGIGRATAVAFAKRRAHVVIAGRNDDAGAHLVEELQAFGADCAYRQCDVRSEDDIKAVVALATERFGRLDFAVNNAGTDGAVRLLVEHDNDTFSEVFDINVRGTWLAMKYQMLAMAKNGGGGIVNVSSTMAFRARPNLGLYGATKQAVEGLTRSGAVEGAAFGIRVNAIAPGQIESPMLDRVAGRVPGGLEHIAAGSPMKRLGKAEEAAELIVFLASPAASFVTGQSVAVEGGRLAV